MVPGCHIVPSVFQMDGLNEGTTYMNTLDPIRPFGPSRRVSDLFKELLYIVNPIFTLTFRTLLEVQPQSFYLTRVTVF